MIIIKEMIKYVAVLGQSRFNVANRCVPELLKIVGRIDFAVVSLTRCCGGYYRCHWLLSPSNKRTGFSELSNISEPLIN